MIIIYPYYYIYLFVSIINMIVTMYYIDLYFEDLNPEPDPSTNEFAMLVLYQIEPSSHLIPLTLLSNFPRTSCFPSKEPDQNDNDEDNDDDDEDNDDDDDDNNDDDEDDNDNDDSDEDDDNDDNDDYDDYDEYDDNRRVIKSLFND